MPNLSTLNPSARRRVLVYGKVGAGKTIFASSFPGRKYFADFDGKVSSAAAWYAGSPEKLSLIDYDEYTIDKAFDRFNNWLRAQSLAVSAGKFEYETVIVDSLTTLLAAMLEDFMLKNGAVQRTRTSIGTIPSMLDYRAITMQVREVFHRLFSLPAHIVVLAHIRTEKDELTGAISTGPEGPNGVVTYLQVIFEEVYRAYVEGEGEKRAYKAQTQNSAQYPARSQIKGMPAVIDLSYESLKKFGG